jgi:glutamyl-tRNA reductase
MSLIVIGLNHRTSAVEVRERFAFSEEVIPETLATLRSTGLAQEGVILSTCNRVELYAAGEDDSLTCAALQKFFLAVRQYSGALNGEIYVLREPQSLQHLFRVASGLDSMALGETEILGQIKKAYDLARLHKHTGCCLNRAFQRAFNVAKHIRSETRIQRGCISVASVAVELVEKVFSTLSDREVMVIGAGDTSEKTAKALLSRGVQRVLVSNRTPERAAALAESLGGKAVPFERWAAECEHVDIVISSTAANHYVIDSKKLAPLMKLRPDRPLLLIDIAVPRDIDPEVNLMDNVYLYNIADLKAIADGYLKQRRDEITRCEDIIMEKVNGLLSKLRSDTRFSGTGLSLEDARC